MELCFQIVPVCSGFRDVPSCLPSLPASLRGSCLGNPHPPLQTFVIGCPSLAEEPKPHDPYTWLVLARREAKSNFKVCDSDVQGWLEVHASPAVL